jgi:hypothetical protein
VSLVSFYEPKENIQSNEVKQHRFYFFYYPFTILCTLTSSSNNTHALLYVGVKTEIPIICLMMAPPTDSGPRHLAFWPSHRYHTTDALHTSNDASEATKSPQSIASFETSVSLESPSISLLSPSDHRTLPRLRLQPRPSFKNDAADADVHYFHYGMGLKKENQGMIQSQILLDAKATTSTKRYSLYLEPMPRRIFLPDI